MKKKYFGFSLMVVLILALASFSNAAAAFNTGIDIVSLSSSSGTVTVEFFNADGSSAGTLPASTISAFGSLNYYIPTTSLASGQYSARVSSDVPIAATVGLTDNTEQLGDNYLGTDSPDTTLTFPLVYRSFGNWNSQIVIQNASSTAQTVNINFYKNGSTSANASDSATIQPYSYKIFDLSSSSYSGFGNDYGVAVVTGAQPLAGTALAVRDPGTGPANKAELIYRAFSSSQLGTSLVAPLFYKNFNGFATGINVVNRGSVATNVTVVFSSANGVAGGPWTASKNSLQPGEGYTFYTPSISNLPSNVFGSATISSSASNIAAVISSSRFAGGSQQAFAYEAPLQASATGCVALPVVHNRTTWKTGINIINLSSSSATVTVNYSSSNPSTGDASKTYSVPAGAPYNIYMPSDAATTLGFYGGATLESNQNIVVLASHANSGVGMALNYMGVNYSCP
ncbi:MAG: hypothetical protein IPM53_27560 [Anaerolineaceae bacterium]|nr:hypothetical protein [Anaerolineaceae bacterium]